MYNSLIAQKCKDPACITKWSKDYPGFQGAHKELWSNIFNIPYILSPGKLICNIFNIK